MTLSNPITGNFHEVWLVDTGHFFVVSDKNPWTCERLWLRQMAARRALRMYLPEADLAALPALVKAFEVTRGAYELFEVQKKFRESFVKRRTTLFKAMKEAKSPEQRTLLRNQLIQHLTSEKDHLNKALDLTNQFASILPDEADSAIKQSSTYDAVAVYRAEKAEEERKKKEKEKEAAKQKAQKKEKASAPLAA